jgi:predicted alpha/beta-hydrolase family hydrolase
VNVNAPAPLSIQLDNRASTTALIYASTREPAATLILAHGAGAGQHSSYMVNTARALAALGVRVVTFNFLYTEQRRRIPDRAPALESCYRAVVQALLVHGVAADARACEPIFIGGKSMGGRIATQIAAADRDLPIAGLVLLGYPLHPPGRPEQRRDKHLPSVDRPMLFVQGSKDAFGTPAELGLIIDALGPSRATLHVVAGGDHSFKVARANQAAQAAVMDDVHRTVVGWIQHVSSITSPARAKP